MVRSAARLGDADAAFLLASAYEEGQQTASGKRLVPRNARSAFSWYRCAAELGDPCAQLQLGNLLSEGVGCSRDDTSALLWYRRALRQGYASAANNIAVLYRDKGNRRRAYYWFTRASELGDDDALVEVGKALYSGIGVRRDPLRAIECFRKAHRSSNITDASRGEAAYCLGIAYLEGAGVRRSTSHAKSWFSKATAAMGEHEGAERMLATLNKE